MTLVGTRTNISIHNFLCMPSVLLDIIHHGVMQYRSPVWSYDSGSARSVAPGNNLQVLQIEVWTSIAETGTVLQALYNKDPSPKKVNLLRGAYEAESGKPFVLPSVIKVRSHFSNPRSFVRLFWSIYAGSRETIQWPYLAPWLSSFLGQSRVSRCRRGTVFWFAESRGDLAAVSPHL